MFEDLQIKQWFQSQKDHTLNKVVKILDVEYAHIILKNKDDLYITKYGLPYIENLKPENYWTDKEWFRNHSTRLSGTSSIYHIQTKEVHGIYKNIVLKWNRMGQEIPDARTSDELLHAEFNSPFEEFSLVMELRSVMDHACEEIELQKPVAIYVPSKQEKFWQTGRKEYKMNYKIRSHKEVSLDMNRLYAVIYEWIEGMDAVQAYQKGLLEEKYLKSLTCDSERKTQVSGYVVKDSKANHIILRPDKENKFVKDKQGNISYALIDFELLARTSEHEIQIKKNRRINYLRRQRDRFYVDPSKRFHPHLKQINILGVDYIHGHIASTRGQLWVVGKDPYLFDYFLPERWKKAQRIKLSEYSEIYHTITKDNIHVVWRVSRVGLQPDMDPFKEDEKKILEYGCNSPFEEFSLAIELSNKGLATIYPRAIYEMSGKTKISINLFDKSRYITHENITTPDMNPILRKGREYITVWGYWNGPDEKLAAKDGEYYEGIDLLRAYREGIITSKKYLHLLNLSKEKLSKVGIEDLNLRGSHILISLTNKGSLVIDKSGTPEIRICNFEFLKRR